MLGWLVIAALQGSGSAANPLTLEDALRRARLTRGRVQSAAAGVAEARGLRREAGEIPHANLSFERTGDTPHKHLIVDDPFSWLLPRGPARAPAPPGIRRAE